VSVRPNAKLRALAAKPGKKRSRTKLPRLPQRARDSKKRRAFEVLAAFGKEVAESLLVRPDVVDAFELVQGKFPPGAWVPGQNASVVQFCLVLHGDMAARRIP
jgi:hypothetical protein